MIDGTVRYRHLPIGKRQSKLLKYTICFIKRGNDILMLNRKSAPEMGVWNGVGGKLEPGEPPLEGVLREVYEETGIELETATEKGTVTWQADEQDNGGMYAYLAEVPENFTYVTPKATDEGILDWKPLDWLLHSENQGVAEHVKRFLPIMLRDDRLFDFQCTYDEDGRLVDCRPVPLIRIFV